MSALAISVKFEFSSSHVALIAYPALTWYCTSNAAYRGRPVVLTCLVHHQRKIA